MTSDVVFQLTLLIVETIIVGTVLLLFFRLRRQFGLALLYVTLGAFQLLQTSLVANVVIEFAPGFSVSPGSAIMFSSTLFIMLVVYIRENAAETRSLVYAVVFANLIIGFILGMLSLHVDSALTVINPGFNPELMFINLRIFFSGTIVLIADVVLMILLYELSLKITRMFYLRFFLSLAFVLTFDTVAFMTLAFYPMEGYGEILFSGITSKVSAAVILTAVLIAYFQYFDHIKDHTENIGNQRLHKRLLGQIYEFFGFLTYRQRYDLLREEFNKDAMTGLKNRGFFDRHLQPEIQRAMRLSQEVSLLMIDIDHFKSINDNHGHIKGDEVICLLSNTIEECCRRSDMPCRYGGEEFAVIMPDTNSAEAIKIAQRIREAFAKAINTQSYLSDQPVTITVGIASYPTDAESGFSLLEVADERLYFGKRSGRDQIIDGGISRAV